MTDYTLEMINESFPVLIPNPIILHGRPKVTMTRLNHYILRVKVTSRVERTDGISFKPFRTVRNVYTDYCIRPDP
jgi:hypothetical protein